MAFFYPAFSFVVFTEKHRIDVPHNRRIQFGRCIRVASNCIFSMFTHLTWTARIYDEHCHIVSRVPVTMRTIPVPRFKVPGEFFEPTSIIRPFRRNRPYTTPVYHQRTLQRGVFSWAICVSTFSITHGEQTNPKNGNTSGPSVIRLFAEEETRSHQQRVIYIYVYTCMIAGPRTFSRTTLYSLHFIPFSYHPGKAGWRPGP